MNRRRFLAISAAFAATGAQAGVTEWQVMAFGGTVRVDLRGPRALSETVVTRIAAVIEQVQAAASLFRPESALSRLNRDGALDDPPAALSAMLTLAGQVHHATGGVFDPTVQPLWQALAQGGDPVAARQRIGWGRVRIGAGIALGPGQAITLNGIAQGYAADRVRDVLQAAGYDHVLIDMGEFAAIGGPFRLGLSDPAMGVFGARTLTGGAFATSSPGATIIGGQPHILGPQGQRAHWSTISVMAESAAMADATSTAFCLMDAGAIRTAQARLPGIGQVMAVDLSADVMTI